MDSMMKIGERVPDFELSDLDGTPHALEKYRGKLVVINFWSAECPWSRRADETIVPLLEEWGSRVVALSIASNANETHEEIAAAAESRGVSPVLLDSDQHVVRMFGATITPEIFVIDTEGILRYRGAFSDANFRNPEPTRIYLEETVNALLAGESPSQDQAPAYGCTIFYG